jgi:hypothetical protein
VSTLRSFLVITTPAADPALLTIAQMRVAAKLDPSDGSQDADLAARGLAVAAGIMAECRIAVGQGGDPTLLQETLTETFYSVEIDELMLARRHNVAITSITVDGTALTAGQWVLNSEAGILTFLLNDCPRRWCARKIVAVYQAGFATIPDDLVAVAIEYFTGLDAGIGT